MISGSGKRYNINIDKWRNFFTPWTKNNLILGCFQVSLLSRLSLLHLGLLMMKWLKVYKQIYSIARSFRGLHWNCQSRGFKFSSQGAKPRGMKMNPRDWQFQCSPRNDRAIVFLHSLLKKHIMGTKYQNAQESLISNYWNIICWRSS